MPRIAYLDCHSGISGDMFLGALLDAGLSLDTLKQGLASLPLTDYQLSFEPFADKGICGSRLDVLLSEHEQPTRHLSDIAAILDASSLPLGVRERALTIFQCLAQAEAAVDGSSVEDVHFNEAGSVDAMVGIICAALGL